MPCYDERSSYRDDPETLKRLDKVTRLLCYVMGYIGVETTKILCFKNPELKQWWSAHQEHDRKREEAEQMKKAKERIKEKALAKLSYVERKALGL